MVNHVRKAKEDHLIEKNINLTPLGRQLVDYLMNNPKESIFLSARELAEKNKVSLSTVVRFVRQLIDWRFTKMVLILDSESRKKFLPRSKIYET